MKVEILYCAWNRLAMTKATFQWMVAHTDWKHVSKLVVYDDGSDDGTQEWLRGHISKSRVPHELRISDLRSPVAIMGHYLATCEADWFVKIDNDIALPGSWLNHLLEAQSTDGSYELVGMEAGMVALDGRDGKTYDRYRIVPCSHIGGVGLMSVEAFRSRPGLPVRGRFGFTEWQNRYEPKRGWIIPDLHCPQLDRVPFEPWASLSETYIDSGWQREWPKYDDTWMVPYYEWLLPQEEVA